MLQGSGPTTPSAQPKPKPTNNEKAIVFSKPEQIAEILVEAEKLRLPVLLRYTNDGRAVRGFVEKVDFGNEKTLRIGSISPAGDAVLASYQVIKVEFVLLSKKLFFVTRIRANATARILLNIPEKLYAVERRRNTRFAIPNGLCAFMEFSGNKINLSNFETPFNPDIKMATADAPLRIRLDDISLGGSALSTRFSAVAQLIKPTGDDVITAKLLLPKSVPVLVPIAIRWAKKSTLRIVPGKHAEMCKTIAAKIAKMGLPTDSIAFTETYYRYGTQFSEVSSELDLALRDFIHLCQTADSV